MGRPNEDSSFERLVSINRAITTSLNFNEVLRLIVLNASELFDAEASLILLADDDGVLRVRAAHGRRNTEAEKFSGHMDESIVRELARLLDVDSSEELVTVPVVGSGSLNGLVGIVRKSRLGSREHWLLSALADQAAIALNNARLHELETGEALRQRNESLNALRQSNRQINAILESITDLFYHLDRDWRFTEVNSRAQALFGKDRDELIGQVIWDVFPKAVDSSLHTHLKRAMTEMIPEHFEVLSKIVPDTWFEASAYPSQTGLFVYLRDVTERKRAEEAIRFQAHLLGTVEQAVIATDLEGKITYWNAFAEWLYGWSAAEAIGSNMLNLIPADGFRERAAEIQGSLVQGSSWSGEFLVQKKDGSVFTAMVTDSPIFDDSGELVGVVGVSVDISDRKRAEKERARLLESERQAREEAEQANALKDEFLATLSHELRNPLNVILGHSEVILRSEETKQSPFLKRSTETIKRNALAQSQLVRDLLDLSRLHTGKLSLNLEAVAFSAVISNAVETVRRDAAAKEIEIIVRGHEDILFVTADPLRLEQIVWNLLNNAVKFTPQGGRVVVTLVSDGATAVLSVKDTGEGIEPSFLPHVFDMFRQADASSSRKFGGLGIGLALVRQLVQLQGGTVVAASDGRGKGAEFTISIPVSRETNRAASSSPQSADVLADLRVLIVDDSQDTLEMLACLLELEGATVDSASSGAEALELAADRTFDAVVSDISMPEMDGFQFLSRLRRIPGHKDVPVLALTGFGRAEDVKRAESAGFVSHVTKPLDFDNLVEMLRQISRERARVQTTE
jgi:PAS domain S-box-containing protein